jgi:phosphoribosylaminoimidazole-succinocarboxamide synthase
MSRRRQIYEGKAKILYEGPEPGTIIQYFKDDATAFNAQKKGTINGKGVINNRISEHVFTRLSHIGIPPTSSAGSTCASNWCGRSKSCRSKWWCAMSRPARSPSGWAS